MVQYTSTTLFVAAAVLFAAMPALADSTTTPRLNRKSARELYRREQAHEPSTLSRRSLYYPRGPTEGESSAGAEKTPTDKEGEQNKPKTGILNPIRAQVLRATVMRARRKAEEQRREKERRKAQGNLQRRDVTVEELLTRMFEREFYDDLD